MRGTRPNRGIIKEILVFISATLFFLALCASIGVSRSARRAVPVVAASETEDCSVSRGSQQSLVRGNY